MICKGTNILGSRKGKKEKAIRFSPKMAQKRSLNIKKSEKSRKMFFLLEKRIIFAKT
jgi:hypothetical protein